MSETARTLGIGQAFYGSFSGHHDYRILAASPGLSARDREAILEASNLGGTGLTAENPGPFFSAYDLDRRHGRRAFSRTVFLGRRQRGNDYLAHILILDPEALQVLRGDLFLLEDLGLLSSEKPAEERDLDLLPLDSRQVEARSRRLLGAGHDERISRSHLAGVLRGLGHGPLAHSLESDEGTALCRSVLAVLPPEDRERLSFCSRFSLPRSLKLDLAVYHPDDQGLATRYLPDFGHDEPAPEGPDDPVDAWLEEVGRGIHPLYGLSLLEEPGEAALRAGAFRAWSEWVLRRGEGRSPVEAAERRGLRVGELVTEPLNRDLEPVRFLETDAALQEVLHRVEAVLSGRMDQPLTLLAEACARVRDRDPESRAVDERLSRETRLRNQAGGMSLEDVTTGIVLALLVPARAWLDRIYGGDSALLRSSREAAGWLSALHQRSPVACAEILTAWLIRWRVSEGSRILAEVGGILADLIQHDPSGTAGGVLRVGRDALNRTAPPAGADGRRKEWFLGMLTDVRPRLGELFSVRDAAHLVVEEGLLPVLGSAELAELAPVLVSEQSGRVSAWMDASGLPDSAVPAFLHVCRDGLLGQEMNGLGWDVHSRPERWDLASRVAEQAARLVRERPNRVLAEDLAWLLWAASRLMTRLAPIAGDEADRRLLASLRDLVRACPEGVMDVVLWTTYRLVRFANHLELALGREELLRFRQQAWEDGRKGCPDDRAWFAFKLRMSYLDRTVIG